MADKPSGSGAGNNNRTSTNRNFLSLKEVLDAVLDSTEESSDDECDRDSSLEDLSDFDEESHIQFVPTEPCYRDSRLYFDVST